VDVVAQFMPERLREAIRNISASLQAAVQTNGVQALSVGIVYDQELVWGQGYGLIDTADPSSYVRRITLSANSIGWDPLELTHVGTGRKVDTNTIYRVGSITKLITNVMLFQLRDQGKLSLDEPVSVRGVALVY
jgi:CubicO group peptidase (beta-lactamase class C family)